MEVEVVYAWPGSQQVVKVHLKPGATVSDAVIASGFTTQQQQKFGIFGKAVPPDTRVAQGDRVEIYRPLLIDPKEARRNRARKQRR
ncbi:MAG TPA: RnfH family protein [Burkholderiales bacterium]|nr:RnfH family protein [Burkholderiales bacterium]